MTIAAPNTRDRSLATGAGILVLAGIGAALYAVANWTTLHVLVPGTENIDIRPQYGLVTFFGYAFGPLVGFLVGFVGNTVGDQLSYGEALGSWWWSVANGLAGLISGAFAYAFVNRATASGQRALIAGTSGVVATGIGFLFIWVELWVQPNLGADYIFREEYLPTLIANSAVAVILTPVLVLAWEPLRQQLTGR
jgi:energy-coupling factor transport system substrate-specific component